MYYEIDIGQFFHPHSARGFLTFCSRMAGSKVSTPKWLLLQPKGQPIINDRYFHDFSETITSMDEGLFKRNWPPRSKQVHAGSSLAQPEICQNQIVSSDVNKYDFFSDSEPQLKLLKIGECSRLGCSNRRLDLGISRFTENISPSNTRD